MLIGYARCSSLHQNLDRQLEALTVAGCEITFQEKASGKDMKARPQLLAALERLKEDDILVLAEWDRATRSMMDGISIMQTIAGKGALVRVLDKPFLDLTTPIGQGVLALLSALAQDERQRINTRSSAGRRIAKDKGVKFGPKFKMDDIQRVEAVKMMQDEGRTKTDIARLFKVSVSTISRLGR